ncbi:hypothetical protein SAMN05660666_03719 [Novosphingobium aromaticivorans]|nr:hypothetical protein SAMN05660666_03719 [Novosphingobium aromaticivorans]
MFKYASEEVYRLQRERKAASIIARAIVFATPTGIVHCGHSPPKLTRGVGYDWKWPAILPGVTSLWPTIDMR